MEPGCRQASPPLRTDEPQAKTRTAARGRVQEMARTAAGTTDCPNRSTYDTITRRVMRITTKNSSRYFPYMETDSFFWKVFKQLPQTLFESLELAAPARSPL